MSTKLNIPPEVPERLRGHAANLSWEDCVNLLNLYETQTRANESAELRARRLKLADDMRILVNALPYEWEVPEPKEHGVVTAVAEMLRTGEMPPIAERYKNRSAKPVLKRRGG